MQRAGMVASAPRAGKLILDFHRPHLPFSKKPRILRSLRPFHHVPSSDSCMNLALRPATVAALNAFRARRSRLLHLRAALIWLAVALASLAILALLDRLRLLPESLRPWLSLTAYGAAFVFAWRLAWSRLRAAQADTHAARLIEETAPALHERLLAAVELSQTGATASPLPDSPEFRARLQDEVASEVQGLRWSRLLPLASLKPAFLRCLGLLVLLALLASVPRLHFPGFLARAALPFAALERPASVRIAIIAPSPADALAPFVSEVEIAADITGDLGSEPVRLEFGEVGAPTRQLEMVHQQGTRFEQSLPVGQSDLRYRVQASDGLTAWHRISARARPSVESFVKIIHPPAYTGQQPVTLTEAHGDLEALEGSRVQLALKTPEAVQEARLLTNPTDPVPPAAVAMRRVSDREFAGELLIEPGLHSWQALLTAAETGFTNEESHPWRITPVADAPPTVALTEPADLLQLQPDESLRVLGLASDDVGLKSAALRHSVNAGDPVETTLPLPAGSREAPLNHLLALAPLHVKGGDSLLLQWVVTDLKGQTAESPPVRIVIQEQVVDPRLRAWSEAQQRLAATADSLDEQTRELREAASKVQKNASLAKRDQPANDPEGQLARLKAALDASKQLADDLWQQTQAAARTAPNRLALEETRLLGERLTKLRQSTLPQLSRAAQEPIESTEPLKKAASEAQSLSDTLQKAAHLFAAEAASEVATRAAQHLQRQEMNLVQTALPSNRDAEQRARWQEQQRAALASTQALDQDLQALQNSATDRGQTRALEQVREELQETATDLRASLDTAEQKKSPEHLYGAADNLRNRLQKAADHTRAIADSTNQRAAQLREQLNRQDNAALVALDEAKAALEDAAKQANDPKFKPRSSKDGLTPDERARQKLAEAARQLQDQADLRSQSIEPADSAAALDASRLSRAADQLERDTREAAKAQAAAASEKTAGELTEAAQKATDLAQAARALQTEATLQAATQTLAQAVASEPAPAQAEAPSRRADPQQLARTAADTQAAAEALRAIAEPLRKNKATQEPANLAQQAADQARAAAQQQSDQVRQTAQNPDHAPQASPQTAQAAQLAQAATAALAAQTEAARATLDNLTPALSELMRQLAQDLKSSQQQTQNAADAAKAEQPVADVAKQAQDLQPQTAADSQRMQSLQSALRQEANQADLARSDERLLARNADVALEQMRRSAPQIASDLKQAAQASASQPQAQSLQNAADTQRQTAEALDQLAENFARMENGEALTAEQLAAMTQMEQELGVQEALDAAYDRAEALANLEEMAQEDPAAALALLEQELAANATMQKALADLGRDTAQAGEQQLSAQANQPAFLGMAAEQAGHDLERVARHENRLNQQQAGQTVASAAQQLKATAADTKTTPGNATPEKSQAATQSAQQASEAAANAAANTLPAPGASAEDQVQAASLAQALDQLDQTLNPLAGAPGQQGQAQEGQQQQGQGSPQQQQKQQGSQQSAQQNLNDAQQSQQQSMAQSRNQGQVPGSQPSQQNMAQNSSQPNQDSQSTNDGGNFQTVIKEGELAGPVIMVPGDWGHLPARTAEELTEATRQDAPPEYRAAIENYYKAIATQAQGK